MRTISQNSSGRSEVGIAPALGAGERRFESCRPDHPEQPFTVTAEQTCLNARSFNRSKYLPILRNNS